MSQLFSNLLKTSRNPFGLYNSIHSIKNVNSFTQFQRATIQNSVSKNVSIPIVQTRNASIGWKPSNNTNPFFQQSSSKHFSFQMPFSNTHVIFRPEFQYQYRYERSYSSNKNDESDVKNKNRSTAMLMFAVIIATIGLAYAAVPLYRMFCTLTGYGGTVKTGRSSAEAFEEFDKQTEEVEMRPIRVYFNSDVSGQLPWEFQPLQREVTVRPGEGVLAFYTAKNLTDADITGVATYNVTPAKAGLYFHKIQCFCFDEQKLTAGESVDMPVYFVVDPKLLTDPGTKDIKSITLSYTFFKTE